MNEAASSLSPLAAYVGSFLEPGVRFGVLVLGATIGYWFFVLIPPVAVMYYLDWKLGADIQMRIGPNRVSAFGILQVLADVIKDFFKEDTGPSAQEQWLFKWGVIAAISCVFLAIGSVPLGEDLALSNPQAGVVVIMASLAFSSLCLFWAAYSARSQWSVLAAYRVLAMVAAYIAPVAIALIPAVLIAGSPNIADIIKAQGGLPWHWIMFQNPGAFISGCAMFLAMMIWQGRAPFDYAHSDNEIAGGFGAEYSGMRRGLLTFLEYSSLLLSCVFVVAVYMGGWQTPFDLTSFGRAANVVQFITFMSKIMILVLMSIWIRWSLPAMRIDQIVSLSWRVLVPVGLLGSASTAVWLYAFAAKAIGDGG